MLLIMSDPHWIEASGRGARMPPRPVWQSWAYGSAPAQLHAFGGIDGGHAIDRCVGHELDAGIEEVLAFGRLWQ